MRNNISMSDLEAFVAVADNLSFRAAASALNLSPSALSRRIQKLETTLNTQLLERSTREVRLTIPGLQIYGRAQELTESIEELLDASNENARYARRVVVACNYSHSQTFIPPAMKQFTEEHPKVFVEVRSPRADDALELVRRGLADFAISDMGLQDAYLEFVPFCDERVVLATHHNHPLAGEAHISWGEVIDEKYIGITRTSPIRVLLDFELARARVNLTTDCEVGNLHSALSCVVAGVGVTASPEITASAFSSLISLVPLTNPSIVVSRGLVRLKDRALRTSAQALWDCIMIKWDRPVLQQQ